MLAQLEKPTHDFFALARYLVGGRERPPNPSRVAWTIAQNLPTDDPLLAAQYMTATAEQSKRCKNACYHTIIAWALDECPSRGAMQEIARKTLAMADLGEHQALVMGHGDKAHAHLHMMINRVHPATGKAWSTGHDYRRFDRIMRQLSEEHGFQYVPAHAFNPDLTDDLPKKPNSKATWAARRGLPTDRPQWSMAGARKLGERLSERADRATTWEDLEEAFAEQGLALEEKGKGLVAGDQDGYVKFSALKLSTTAKGFERKFGRRLGRRGVPPSRSRSRPRPKPPARNLWTVDAIDVARALGSREDVRSAVQEATAQRKARIAKAPWTKQLEAELKEVLKATTSLKQPHPRRSRPSNPRRSDRSRR